ncbi:MAG: hypothetical protein DMD94_21130 [Candidatus Rokuibacteriota bacterium]|nr:MAG: hypothetical protein DMD94_21130 [Candidatus Rokubacteria bacterium]
MIQVSVGPVASTSPHSRSPAMLDTATTSSLHVGVVRGYSAPKVSYSVMEESSISPLDRPLQRIARTVADLTAAIQGQTEAALARRPDAASWAAKEIVCHLRDIEELFLIRLEAIAAIDEPVILAAGMGARAT